LCIAVSIFVLFCHLVSPVERHGTPNLAREIRMTTQWDGIPPQPECSAWHWVEDATGLRPLLWRGDDWPDAVDRREWEDGVVVCAPDDMREATYFGPVTMPPAVARRFASTRLAVAPAKRPRFWESWRGLS
jgi:hypothetical protein